MSKTTDKLSDTSVVLNVFKDVIRVVSAQQESGIRKAICLSVTVYNKLVSSQCSLNAKIESVQEKRQYVAAAQEQRFVRIGR